MRKLDTGGDGRLWANRDPSTQRSPWQNQRRALFVPPLAFFIIAVLGFGVATAQSLFSPWSDASTVSTTTSPDGSGGDEGSPDAPANAHFGASEITGTWDAVDGAEQYQVECDDGKSTVSDTTTDTTHTFEVDPAESYDCRVRAEAEEPLPEPEGYAAHVLEDNPIAYWRFEETSGGTASDETGNHDGSVNGANLDTAGPEGLGSASAYDGTNDFVDVPSITIDGDLTVEAWVRTTDTSRRRYAVAKMGAKGTEADRAFGLAVNEEASTEFTAAAATSQGYHPATGGTVTDGEWHHVAMTYEGGTVATYVDGQQVDSVSGPGGGLTGTGLEIGQRAGHNDPAWWDGAIDEVAVFDHALDSERIAERYAEGGGEPGSGDPGDGGGDGGGGGDPGDGESLDCTNYASPSGGGDGSSESSPYQIDDFWSDADPGDTLCLLDGVYTGSSSMITPPSSVDGTDGNPVTIAALNDGEVRINGQGRNNPISLSGNDWLVIQGMDAHNARRDVVGFWNGSDNNVVRRVVAWDAQPDRMVFRLWGGSTSGLLENNLLEDVAGFGTGRKIYQPSELADNNTFRRTWGMWNAGSGSPRQTYTMGYESQGNTCENCIGTFDADSSSSDGHRGIFSNNSMERHDLTDGTNVDGGYIGSIAYMLEDQRAGDLRGLLESFRVNEGVFLDHTVAYTEQSDLYTTRLRGDSGQDDKVMSNVTEIGGRSSIASVWDVIDSERGSNVDDVASIWEDAGDGAQVCHRYEDREVTDEPLWPWPMDQRISDALETAGREPVIVTDLMEDLFGEIPDECRQ